jgi:hypothetical protein
VDRRRCAAFDTKLEFLAADGVARANAVSSNVKPHLNRVTGRRVPLQTKTFQRQPVELAAGLGHDTHLLVRAS